MVEQVKYTDLASLVAGMTQSSVEAGHCRVLGLTLDSRKVKKGDLFIALAKNSQQRLSHIQHALEKGSDFILFDTDLALSEQEQTALTEQGASAIAIDQLADHVSEIAGRFYGHPSLALTIIAITGTDGKTSVSQFIAQCLENLGQPCGVIGTLGVGRLGQLIDTGMTTPDPITLQAMLAEFCQQSIPYVVIEASSHALEQGRLNNVAIDVAVLTNLSRDHLDYHQDLNAYAAAKRRLFEFDSLSTAVVNSSDEFGQAVIDMLAEDNRISVLSYSSVHSAMLAAKDIKTIHSGLSFSVSYEGIEESIKSNLIGRFNVDNLLATMGSLLAIDVSYEQIVSLLTQCHSVQGRMEVYGGEKQVQAVIDFAHTPDAIEQALISLREHVSEQGKLWCVFGCGGDRDTGKRPLMGASAEHYADEVVLTSDNPRSEHNTDIVAGILQGIKCQDSVHIEHDRAKAIRYALSQANQKDIVLVAGKGHEAYQDVAGVKLPYSDEQVVVSCLADLNVGLGGMQ